MYCPDAKEIKAVVPAMPAIIAPWAMLSPTTRTNIKAIDAKKDWKIYLNFFLKKMGSIKWNSLSNFNLIFIFILLS